MEKSGKKIVDFDPTLLSSFFQLVLGSLGFSDKKKKDTIVDNKKQQSRYQMKKLFALLLFLPSAAFADIKQEFVTSAQITVICLM